MATAGGSLDDLMADAIGSIVDQTRMPVAFGGFERSGRVVVENVIGARSGLLDALVVERSRGLGGRAIIEHRPRLTLDYGRSRQITHDYDHAILGEGLATLFAVPVVVGGRSRAVLYCGSRERSGLAAEDARRAVGVAGELAVELRVRDEVERRVAATAPTLPPRAEEQLRGAYAELRSIAADVRDPALRARLGALGDALPGVTGSSLPRRAGSGVSLSPRERDVLSCVALGASNAETGARLGLREGTVKSYLQSAMVKLDATTRHAAVVAARREGLLP